jgi:mobilization protein
MSNTGQTITHFNSQLTDKEFVNATFEPQEQVNGKQAELLGRSLRPCRWWRLVFGFAVGRTEKQV